MFAGIFLEHFQQSDVVCGASSISMISREATAVLTGACTAGLGSSSFF